MEKLTKYDIIQTILENVEADLSNEEIIHRVLSEQLSSNAEERDTFGQRAADKLAKFAGSWAFIIGFSVILLSWIVLNMYFLVKAFDPFPFILLNLVLSCVAAIQAPLIMMSQNRQEEKDRRRAENDYRVNLKTEIIIQDLHYKLDHIQSILTQQQQQQNKEDFH